MTDYQPGSIGAMFPEAASLVEGLLAERNALEIEVGRLSRRLSDVDLIRRAICDPGQFLPRGDNYTEPITSWSARAVVAALAATESVPS